MASMIPASTIRRAEEALARVSRLSGDNPMGPVSDMARVDPGAANAFVAAQSETLHKLYPDIDPRLDPAFNTMFFHCLCTGILAGRMHRRGE